MGTFSGSTLRRPKHPATSIEYPATGGVALSDLGSEPAETVRLLLQQGREAIISVPPREGQIEQMLSIISLPISVHIN
jgi:hypothetical protein